MLPPSGPVTKIQSPGFAPLRRTGPRLVAWQREDAESVRVRDALRASARQWAERAKPSGLLWRKETLAELKTWRPRFAGRLTRLETEFVTASLRDEARRSQRKVVDVAEAVASSHVLLPSESAEGRSEREASGD